MTNPGNAIDTAHGNDAVPHVDIADGRDSGLMKGLGAGLRDHVHVEHFDKVILSV